MELVKRLREEKGSNLSGGIYHKLQVEFTYNSNHIEGSRLTKNQTIYIFETNTIYSDEAINIDDIIETCKFAQDEFKKYLDYFEIEY